MSDKNTVNAAFEAEQSVLGSMMLDASCIRDVSSKLQESDFAVTLHRTIFRTVVEMDMSGRIVDGLTVAEEMRKSGAEFKDSELRSYLAQLHEVTPTAANAMEYAEIVQTAARRRFLKEALQSAEKSLEAGSAEEDILPPLENAIQSMKERSGSDLIAPMQQVESFLKYREQIDAGGNPCVRTGIDALDRLLGRGMVKKGLYFLGARPGVGKTALAISIAEFVASKIGPVVFISMEMNEEQITARRVAALAKVNSKVLLTDKMTEREYGAVVEKLPAVQKTPFYLTGGRPYPIGRITGIARSQKGAALVVVDHFSLIQIPGKQQSFVEYAMVAHALKKLAQDMNTPVLCLAQLSRENEGKLPHLSDLRATGAAEEDADGVFFLHRADLYDKNYKREENKPVLVDILVAKNRYGSTGRMNISYYPETNLFRDGRIC